jgi:hypothetical protein
VVVIKPRLRCQTPDCKESAMVRCPVHHDLLCPVHFRLHALEKGCRRLP